jgi:hypothetical protein
MAEPARGSTRRNVNLPSESRPCLGEKHHPFSSGQHYYSHLIRGVTSCPQLRTILDRGVYAALDQSSLPAFLPHSSRLSHQVVSARAHGLERAPSGPALAPPRCVSAHLQTGLASAQRGVPPGCFSHPACSWTGRESSSSLTLPAPFAAMSRDGEPLHLVHVFYSTPKGALCQGVGYVGSCIELKRLVQLNMIAFRTF